MTILNSAVARIKTALHRELHRRASADVLTRPPAVTSLGGPTIVSMVGSSQVLMYLCAIKSFSRQISAGRFAVLDDGSLTADDRAMLHDHVENLAIHSARDIDTGVAPRGGCWERLLLITELGRSEYVIQLDSDTLTIGSVAEVADCVAAGASFTLITSPTSHFVSLSEAARRARKLNGDHFQFIAERALDQLPQPDNQQYVRGCAAFAGFSPAAANREAILDFSRRMETSLGGRWKEWGSEQVTSNWVVANAKKLGTIPYPKYRNYEGQPVATDTALLHFIGTFRFAGSGYTRMTRQVIGTMPDRPMAAVAAP